MNATSIALGLVVGAAAGFALAGVLRPSQARCCQQLEQVVRADVRKRCGGLASICEGAGDVLGLFGNSSSLLDAFGVTK